MTDDSPTRPDPAAPARAAIPDPSAPGSSSSPHPADGIPLPEHGFDPLDAATRELATVPASEQVARVAVSLMSAAAEQLGLSPSDEPELDLDEAHTLISALAGLLAGCGDRLGAQGPALHEGLRTLQQAYRETSSEPVAEGEGPGEQLSR